MNNMKIRWRQQEIILVNIIAAILLISFLRITLGTPQSVFAEPFINNHVSFNLYRNLIFPELGMGVLIYFAYMFLSLFAIPQLLIPVGQGTIKIVALSKSSLSKLVKNIIKK